jgi:3-oxoacyl-[acyl-carrier protein] reductase
MSTPAASQAVIQPLVNGRTPLTGKVALVTGASRGIGAAIARRLAADGADVVLTYARSAEAAQAVVRDIEALGRRARAIQADAADARAAARAVTDTVEAFGRLDILVNNAGLGVAKPFTEFTLEEFDQIVAVNVRAVFAATQAAAPHLRVGGRVITIGSCLAEVVDNGGAAVYAMTKSALIGLNKGIARDLAPRGITANLVHPGPVDTDMNPADGPNGDYYRALLPLGHFGAPEDIAGAVAYLASEESRFITGTAITIDGGLNI